MRYSKESFPLQKPTMCTTFEAHNNGHFIFTALSIILKQHPPSELMKHTDINLTVQALLPYVTGYWKTDHVRTFGQLLFIGPANRHSYTLPVHCCINGLS